MIDINSSNYLPFDAERVSGYMCYKIKKKGNKLIPFVWINGEWKLSTTDVCKILKMPSVR